MLVYILVSVYNIPIQEYFISSYESGVKNMYFDSNQNNDIEFCKQYCKNTYTEYLRYNESDKNDIMIERSAKRGQNRHDRILKNYE